ncbi:MAG: hypothetical protein SVR94_17445, partial [Pseudomonadota bacterium]|nr:hypothetical protein [Pseudomonadota bacterium]
RLNYKLFWYYQPLYQWNAQAIVEQFFPLKHIGQFSAHKGLVTIHSLGEDPIFWSRDVDFASIYQNLPQDNPILKYILYTLAVVIALLIVFMNALVHYYQRSLHFLPSFGIYFLFPFVLALIVAMSAVSQYNYHPDEHHHFLTAQYYVDHWLPPEIGDPATRATYSGYGASYINTPGIDYFLAGKFAWLVSPFFEQEIIAVRVFNVSLFLLLIVIYGYRSRYERTQLLPLTVVLITPQIWYIFGYINGDAFALFLSFILISEITYRRSPFNQFLTAKTFKFFSGGLLFGILLALLYLSKTNYHVFILFMGVWFIYSAIKYDAKKLIIDKRKVVRFGFIVVIALVTVMARSALHVAINGFDYQAKLRAYQQQIAQVGYRHVTTTAKSSLPNTCGINSPNALINQNVSYLELFTDRQWHIISFASFVGLYGIMSIISPRDYYILMGILYAGFLSFLALSVLFSKKLKAISLMIISLSFVGLMIFISSYHSWTCDFQPQGRYWFPVMAILGLLIYQTQAYLNNILAHFFIISLFSLSAYSFIFVALYRYGTLYY